MKQRIAGFWKNAIKPRFDERALNYEVRLADGTKKRYVNLDNAATTIPFLKVVSGLEREMLEYGSVHRGSGEKSKISSALYEEARETVRKFVNARKTDYVVFNANTTIGMNQLAYFFAHIKGLVLVSDMEHSSSWLPWIFQEGGYATTEQVALRDALAGKTEDLNKKILLRGKKKVLAYKTKPDFSFDLNDIERVFKERNSKDEAERIKVLVVTGASNVTGYKPPIKELAKIAHKYGALIVVDCCQLLQHEKIDMQEQGIDFAVFSSHKMYAPFGSGALVGNKRLLDAFWPYQMGGGNFPYITADGEVLRLCRNQAHDPGTPNFAGARALHYSIKELEKIGMPRLSAYERALTTYAFERLKGIKGVTLFVDKNEQGLFDSSLITFNIDGVPPKLVGEILNCEYGIAVRANAFCVYEFARRVNGTTLEQDKRIALEVKTGKTANIPGSVRASFGMYNNKEDADRLISAVKEIAGNGFGFYKKHYKMDKLNGCWQPLF